MAVRGVGFVGMRTKCFDETVALLRDVIGIPVGRHESGLVGFVLQDGTPLEIYDADERFHEFFATGPVVGLKVDDFKATRAAMIAAGTIFVGKLQAANGTSWQHFLLPDGTIAEIIGA
jgi:hypothetical protein